MKSNTSIIDPVVKKSDAIKAAEYSANLARLLNVNKATVSSWGEFLPPLYAYRIVQIFPYLQESQKINEFTLTIQINGNPCLSKAVSL